MRIWVRSPHSARKITPKPSVAIFRNPADSGTASTFSSSSSSVSIPSRQMSTAPSRNSAPTTASTGRRGRSDSKRSGSGRDHDVDEERGGDAGEHPAGGELRAEDDPGDRGLVRKFGDEHESEDGGDHGEVEHVMPRYAARSAMRVAVCRISGRRHIEVAQDDRHRAGMSGARGAESAPAVLDLVHP